MLALFYLQYTQDYATWNNRLREVIVKFAEPPLRIEYTALMLLF